MSGDGRKTGKQPRPGTQIWIFQANPAKYAILDSLRTEPEEYWNLRQHANEVALGDRVVIWLSGKQSGVYAVGTVVASPVDMADSPSGQTRWSDKKAGTRVIPRVLVRYDRTFLGCPLYKDFIACDPDLWQLEILRRPIGTNFPVTAMEWRALQGWLDDDASENGVED